MPRRPAFPLLAVIWGAAAASGQTVCPPTPQYTPCDLVFTLPNAPADLHAEVQSPRHITALVNAFSDGPSRWVIRFTPAEIGTYTYRLTSSVAEFNNKEGQFTAADGKKAGWLRSANLHHFALVEGNNLTPHLWMGAVVDGFPSMTEQAWRSLIDMRASQHFNHLAVTLVDKAGADFRTPEYFRGAEAKLLYANQHGITIDLAFFGGTARLDRMLPTHNDRDVWFRMALARLAAFDVTWDGIEDWESYPDGRALLKEIYGYVGELDPYKHTRGTRASLTSAPLADDGWLRFRSYQTSNSQVQAVEQQAYIYPAVSNFGTDSRDASDFRRRLWTATVNGEYPQTAVPNEECAAALKAWYEFMNDTRHWELEPYFDIENGRGLALEGVEYVVFPDRPGSVTVQVERQTYDVEWLNAATGETTAMKQKNKGEVFIGSPPDATHEWVLHLSREGHKAGMLKSYKFDSREQPAQLQEIEGDPTKVPFEIVEPAADTLSMGAPLKFAVRLKRDSKALHNMAYEWTVEVAHDERSWRVAGTGAQGTLEVPASIAAEYPAALHIKVLGLNGLGKLYTADRTYTLNK